MSITKRLGLLGTLAMALVMGLAACQTSGTMTSLVTDKGENFTSWLAKPEGDGPFPAVVLTHGCSGAEKNTSHQEVWRGLSGHAALLNDHGYVTLIVDSFETRRITDGCQTSSPKYNFVQIRDAHAAFDHLSALPFVDADRIGYVGQSLGGGTAMRLAQEHWFDARILKDQGTFAALVAYYPWCDPSWADALARPVLILIGSEDDWAPASRCIVLHSLAKTGTPDLELKVYPGAYHAFDLPVRELYYAEGANGQFHKILGDPAALRDSQARMLAFFDKHLGASQ